VYVQTSWKALWFALLLLARSLNLAAKNPPPPARMTVSVYNDAHVPPDAIAGAEAEASRIFSQAGLDVNWMLCSPLSDTPEKATACSEAAFPRHLHVRILARSRNLTSSTLGASYLSGEGIGCYADVFFGPIAVHARTRRETGAILGHVIAHEIAHLLLGTSSHSESGIMRARWQTGELMSVLNGQMLFTEEQSQVMRQRLSMARQSVGD
jgi:hypothetical protein